MVSIYAFEIFVVIGDHYVDELFALLLRKLYKLILQLFVCIDE